MGFGESNTSNETQRKNKALELYNAGRYKEAFPLCLEFAEKGEATFQFIVGYCYKEGQGVVLDYKTAVYWYEKAARQGNANAQLNLGICHEKGQGEAFGGDAQAIYWYEKAAERGHSDAQFRLAIHYKKSGKDLKKVLYWMEKAAEQGHAEAQCNLGGFYEIGQGVERDFHKALYWYHKAAVLGNYYAINGEERMKRKIFYKY